MLASPSRPPSLSEADAVLLLEVPFVALSLSELADGPFLADARWDANAVEGVLVVEASGRSLPSSSSSSPSELRSIVSLSERGVLADGREAEGVSAAEAGPFLLPLVLLVLAPSLLLGLLLLLEPFAFAVALALLLGPAAGDEDDDGSPPAGFLLK